MKDKYNSAYTLYQNGLSLEGVGSAIGVTRQCVFKAFKRRGFELRQPNEQPFQEFDGKKFSLRPNGYYALSYGSRISMHRYVWEYYNGPIPKGYDIHHLDTVKANNLIENFECLPKAEHTRKYSPHHNQFTKKVA